MVFVFVNTYIVEIDKILYKNGAGWKVGAVLAREEEGAVFGGTDYAKMEVINVQRDSVRVIGSVSSEDVVVCSGGNVIWSASDLVVFESGKRRFPAPFLVHAMSAHGEFVAMLKQGSAECRAEFAMSANGDSTPQGF